MEEYVIKGGQFNSQNGHYIFAAEVYIDGQLRKAADGTPALHGISFPPEALGCRAVEYGIDPTDSHSLLDIVLHEPYLSADEHGPDHEDFLYATDQKSARVAYLSKIQKVKASRVKVSDPDGHMAIVHAGHKVTPEFIAAMEQHIISGQAAHSARKARQADRARRFGGEVQ